MRLSELLKYESAIEKLLSLWMGVKGAAVGAKVTVPETVVDLAGERWRFESHQATRER